MAAPMAVVPSSVKAPADASLDVGGYPFSSTGPHKHGLRRRGSHTKAFVNKDAHLLQASYLSKRTLADVARPSQDVLHLLNDVKLGAALKLMAAKCVGVMKMG